MEQLMHVLRKMKVQSAELSASKQTVAYKGQTVVSVAIVGPGWHIETCPNKC
jgi:hypothetical protein